MERWEHRKLRNSVEGGGAGAVWENRGRMKSSRDAHREETLKMTQFIPISATKERKEDKWRGEIQVFTAKPNRTCAHSVKKKTLMKPLQKYWHNFAPVTVIRKQS